MAGSKLKLEEVEVESFDVGQVADGGGTVKANEGISIGGTCQGQTAACTACRPLQCY
jgi:hypothetical protein